MKKNVPKLRFPEFTGNWERKKLGEVSEKITEKNSNNAIKIVLTNSALHGIINQTDYFDREIANINNLVGYYVTKVNDFIYNPRISNEAPVGPISMNNSNLGIMSPLYTIFRFNTGNLIFYSNYFKSKHWHTYMKNISNSGARHDRLAIRVSDFFLMPLPFPSLPEQKKIADFLSSIDNKIDIVSKQLENAELYKKSLLQQMFV